MSPASQTVVVVGGGAFGLAAALELRRRGHSVHVLDPGPIPHPEASSTDISKMVRMDYGADDFYARFAAEALTGWDEWNRAVERPLYHEDGFLVMAAGPMRPGGFEYESFRVLEDMGHAPTRIGPADLTRRFPAWRQGSYPDGYLSGRAGWAESGRTVSWLAGEARAAGVHIHAGTAMGHLVERGSRVTGVRTSDGNTLSGDWVVVAAGAWTPALVPELSDVMVTVGQPVLHFGPSDPAPYNPPRFPPWAADIANTGWYGFPATAEGRVKVGHHAAGTVMDPTEPKVVPVGHEAFCRAFLQDTFPALAGAPLVESRLCLYCDTWDGDFWIDRDPDRPGLLIAAGGSGHGFKFVTVLGPLIADVLEGIDNPWAQRFRWRSRGQGVKEEARFTGPAAQGTDHNTAD